MGKAISVKLPHEDVWYAFEQFVVKKWGKKHSMMGLELENAIRLYLQQHAHTDSGKPEDEKPKSRTLKTLKDISEKLGEYREVTDQDVEDVIVKTVGGDHRTVSKYRYLPPEARGYRAFETHTWIQRLDIHGSTWSVQPRL
jgi:antitoxin component of RelBE/YafQ-DinJ toxin-antitoxin module